MLLQASEEWTPLPTLPHDEGEGEEKEEEGKELSSINKKQNMCTVHCKRSFLYLISLRFQPSPNMGARERWRASSALERFAICV